MFNQSFNKIDLQTVALNTYWLRQDLLSNNIANVETPNYKRKDLNFEAFLQDAIDKRNKTMSLVTTNPRHIQPSIVDDESMVYTDNSTSMRLDGNNVNIEQEMAEQAKNTIRYNLMISRVDTEFRRLQSAIKGGR